MKPSALRIPKTAAALALIALSSLIALALLADAPTAGAHAPPLGPTFTFPPEMPQDRQDAYRDYFAAVRVFSHKRFGVSPDTSKLQITIVDFSSTCVVLATSDVDTGEDRGITLDDGCIDESGRFVSSSGSIHIAETYFHLLWGSWFNMWGPWFNDETPDWTTEWMVEGAAAYFGRLWHAHYEDSTTYNDLRSAEIQSLSEIGDPAPLSQTNHTTPGYSSLAFLAIDYLAEQTGATKPIDYFTAERINPAFETHFQSVFGISPDAFYDYFASHRAAGFPQPGAPIVFPTPTRTPTPTPTATPVTMPIVADGRIVFASNRDGDWDIYVMNADGTEVSRLANRNADSFAPAWTPAWSPDGKRIAFSSDRDNDYRYDIYVMNADGTGASRLTDGTGDSSDPDWSPDGQRIAFSSNMDGGDYEIYVMNADGTGISKLTDGTADSISNISPAWSPDGKRIAFSSNRNGNLDIYVMNSDGSNVTRLTNHPATDDWAPAWSPDGRRIAFESRRDYDYQVYVMNADGSRQTRLTKHAGWHRFPAWSPDGQHIVFSSTRDVDIRFEVSFEIYAMNEDGSSPTRLTNHPKLDFDPDWTYAGDAQIDNRVSALEQQTAALRQLLQNLQTLIQALTNRIAALEDTDP